MNILLLGGTGAMGTHLVPLLLERNNNVYVTSRRTYTDKERLYYLIGDAHEMSFLQQILERQWDVIVDFLVYTPTEFKDRVDILLQSTTHYFFLSSARVYSDFGGVINENTPRLLDSSKDLEFLYTNDYSLRKARAENLLFSSSKKNYTILRPYITFSEKRLQLGTMEKERWLYRALNGKAVVVHKEVLKHYTTMTYALDVAKAILSLIESKKTEGEAINLITDVSVRWEDILEAYKECLGKELGFVPKIITYDNLDELKFQGNYYAHVYDRFYDRRFSNEKLKSLDGSVVFEDPLVKLKQCLSDFIKSPKWNGINVFDLAADDRISHEVFPLNKILGITSKIKYLFFRFTPRILIRLIRK